MNRHRCDIYKVAGMCGVYLFDSNGPKRFQPRRPRACFAKKTLQSIGRKHGEGHLALVLRLVVETEGNAKELYRDTLQAISSLIIAYPHLLERGTRLFDEFDNIDLADVRRQARALAVGIPVSHAMRIIIALKLHMDRREDHGEAQTA